MRLSCRRRVRRTALTVRSQTAPGCWRCGMVRREHVDRHLGIGGLADYSGLPALRRALVPTLLCAAAGNGDMQAMLGFGRRLQRDTSATRPRHVHRRRSMRWRGRCTPRRRSTRRPSPTFTSRLKTSRRSATRAQRRSSSASLLRKSMAHPAALPLGTRRLFLQVHAALQDHDEQPRGGCRNDRAARREVTRKPGSGLDQCQ